MKRTISRPIAMLLCFVFLLLSIPGISVGAETTELQLEWLENQCLGSPLADSPEHRGKLYAANGFSISEVFTVPKKGTIVTWYDPKSPYADKNTCILSSWKKDGADWVFDPDGAVFVGAQGRADSKCTAVLEKLTSSGVEYTYVTSRDNETIRVSCHAVGENIPTVTLTTSNKKGYWNTVMERRNAVADYVPTSDILEIPLPHTTAISPNWYRGDIKSNSSGTIVASDFNVYSEPIYIAKKGTQVLFFDDTNTDYAGGTQANASVYAVSVWKKNGDSFTLDPQGKNQTVDTIMTYLCSTKLQLRCYSYQTEQDDIYIRICYRAVTPNPYEVPTPRDVLLIPPEPAEDFGKIDSFGNYQSKSWTPAGTDTPIPYEILLPNDYSESNRYPLVFSNGESHRTANAIPTSQAEVIGIQVNTSATQALRLMESIIRAYRVNPSFIYYIGDTAAVKDYETKLTATAADAKTDADAANALTTLLEKQPKVYYDFMEGLTMYAIGDSYFFGSSIGTENAWPSLLASKYDMHSINYGRGSNTIAMCAQANQGEYYTPICRRYLTMENGDADIILLQGGRNDRSQKVPIGENGSFDENTYKGAINLTVKGLKEKYPNALIVCVTPWNFVDYPATAGGFHGTTKDYAIAMTEVVAAMNDPRVVCINAADRRISGVEMNDPSFRAQYCIAPGDISHLNKDGMKLVLPNFEQHIAKQYAIYKGLNMDQYEFPEDPVDPPVEDDERETGTTDQSEETTIPETDPASTATDTESNGNTSEKGCKSTLGAAALPTAILTGAALLKKKKEKSE